MRLVVALQKVDLRTFTALTRRPRSGESNDNCTCDNHRNFKIAINNFQHLSLLKIKIQAASSPEKVMMMDNNYDCDNHRNFKITIKQLSTSMVYSLL